MTAQERARLGHELARAEHRSRRAAWLGDYAGSVIAASDARRIERRLTEDTQPPDWRPELRRAFARFSDPSADR